MNIVKYGLSCVFGVMIISVVAQAQLADKYNDHYSNSNATISPGGVGTVGATRFIQQQNMAYGNGASATQSSLLSGGAASRGVDGNTSGAWSSNSCVHTNNTNSGGEWWQVNFSTVDTAVDHITIWNRTDSGCTDRLQNFTVAFYTVDPSSAGATAVWSYKYDGNFPASGRIAVDTTAADSSWIRITDEAGRYINFSEVQVYSTTDLGGFSASSNNGAIVDGKQVQSYNFTQSGTGVLVLDVDTTQEGRYDTLSVSGALNEGGTLRLNLMNAAGMTVADFNSMIIANSYSGSFSSVEVINPEQLDSSNIVLFNKTSNATLAAEMVHWKASPEDTNFANINNWSSDPASQEVAIGVYGSEATGMMLATALTLGTAHFGYTSSATSNLTIQDGGSLTVGNGSFLGENGSSTITVEQGGTFTTTGELLLGNLGTASMAITGGTVNFNSLVRVSNQGNNASIVVSGDGKFNTTADFILGQRGTLKAAMTVKDNAVLSSTSNFYVGSNDVSVGSGTLNLQDNVSATFNNLYVGRQAASALNMQDSATVNINGSQFYVGTSSIGSTYNQTGGTTNVSAATTTYIADAEASTGTINLSGNSVYNNAGTMWIAVRGTGIVNVSENAVLNSTGRILLGDAHSKMAAGIINQSGGTVNALNNGISFGSQNTGGSATYNLSDGVLNAGSLSRGASKILASFNMSGGEANIGSLTVPTRFTGGVLNAGTINVSTQAATPVNQFEQSGGTMAPGGLDAIGTTTITGNYLISNTVSTTNIALGKTASQDSNYTNNQFPAGNAVDGNLSTFSHTGTSSAAHSWQVDLGKVTNIAAVTVKNRNESAYAFGQRLTDESGFYVQLLDSDGTTVLWTSQTQSGGYAYYQGTTINIPSDITAQYVKIVRAAASTTPLNLAEVQVLAFADTPTVNNAVISLDIKSETEYDKIVVNGDLDLGDGLATLELNFLDTFYTTGTFQLFDVTGAITGYFADIVVPDIPDLKFDFSNLLIDGTVSVAIPEPATWVLLLLGTAGLLYYRRRK